VLPDEEMVDLIEQAFLEDQIDGLKAGPAYLQLLKRPAQWLTKSRAGD
jgi:hypothetical protein